jgi:predicted Zn-dependent peptidase
MLVEIERVRSRGIEPGELEKAINQLRARLVFESDSVSGIAHQLGHFATIADWQLYHSLHERIARVTIDQVGAAALWLTPAARTIGWFEPHAPGAGVDGVTQHSAATDPTSPISG